MTKSAFGLWALLCSLLVFSMGSVDAARYFVHKTAPDLTQGGKPDDTHDWRLGPLGANGWVFCRSTRQGASRDARQILITQVDKGGPCDGLLNVDDVIIGTGNKLFSSDARKALADAINIAETRQQKGILPLQVWRAGDVHTIAVVLPVLGTYSPTAPFDCEKTDRIIDRACDYLKGFKLENNWHGQVTALGMLATGRKDMVEKVKQYARDICVPGEVLSVEKHQSMCTWRWAYKCIFLAEYYLATGDDYVLPTVREYATKLAMGQSGVGTWGHAVASRELNDGQLHGRLGGYGAINQMGLTAMIALCLADTCGVDNPEVKAAIKRGKIFFGYYIEKGSIPYGDHVPGKMWFDDNGKSGAAAILFDLLGDEEGAQFFSSMVVASSPGGREAGHTGHFWSHLWGGIGAARGGKQASIRFSREMNGPFTLERQPEGRMVFQENAGEMIGRSENKSKSPNRGGLKEKWDCTGARLLQLCIPRHRLYITGKGMSSARPLSKERMDWLCRAGELSTSATARAKLTHAEIMTLLADPLPATRQVAVRALVERDANCVNDLIAMLDSDNTYAQYGACDALREAGYASEAAVARLVSIIENSDDLNLRLLAIDALTGGNRQRGLVMAAKPAIPALLKLCSSRSKDDPRRLLQRKLAMQLFYSGNALRFKGLLVVHGIGGVNRQLLIPAIKELLTVDDGRSRSCVSWVYPKLTESDLQQVWPDIYRATRDLSPSGIMFADGIRLSGLKFMEENNIKEGIDLGVKIMTEDRWGRGHRQKTVVGILPKYGAAAQSALPALKKLQAQAAKARRPDTKFLKSLKSAIETIETSDSSGRRPLKSIADVIKQSDAVMPGNKTQTD